MQTASLSQNSAPLGPYNLLYIYYLQGRPDFHLIVDLPHFIGNWEEDGFSFLFFSKASRDVVSELLRKQPQLSLLDQYEMTYEEWQGGRLDETRIGRFRINPPWMEHSRPRSPESISLVLDPGVVFGNGLHPTTRDCLDALETLWYKEQIQTVLDLGTGTGLLAIAACALGCTRAMAVDYNFLAAKTAKQNVQLNDLDKQILVFQGRAEDFIDRPSDLMLSNIHYDVMKELIGSEAFLAHRWMILSGLLRSEARNILAKLAALPVEIVASWDHDDIWHTYLVKRV